jgi:transposase InsO family protein
MIAATVEELTPIIGTRPACRALGAAPATIYRRRRPSEPRPARPRPTAERALSGPERERVLEVLHSERFGDVSPEEAWATLLDEGSYLCSPRTMYRILKQRHGGVRERRDQLTHPPYAKPELLAERPNELWSWDVSKLKGPAKWTYYYLFVLLDVFSRYIVGWTVQHRENGQLARSLIEQAAEQQKITPGLLTLHADRGGPQRAKPVAFLLATTRSRRSLVPHPAAETSRRVLLVEGEPDMIAARSHGLPAIAVPGVAGWQSRWSTLLADREVVVVMDCDDAGRRAAAAIAHDLSSLTDVRILDLAPERNDGFDLSDWLMGDSLLRAGWPGWPRRRGV